MTKVLITGGAGFIGSHVTERLLGEGDEVVVVDNFSTARRDSLEPHERLTVVEGTIADPELVERAFEFGPEVVLHAAASYKDPVAWAEDARTNVVGSANVVQAAERAGASRLVYLQTALCYGIKPLEQPITLSHPLRPVESSYAISKTAGEHYCPARQRAVRLVPPGQRLRAPQPLGAAADVLPPADQRQALLRHGHPPRLRLRRRPRRPARARVARQGRAGRLPRLLGHATSRSRSSTTPRSRRSGCRRTRSRCASAARTTPSASCSTPR